MPRKRASRKKKKSAINPLVAVLVTGVVLLVLFVSALLFAKSAVRGWLKGDEFRDWLVRKASVALRANVELAETDWQGAEIYSDSFIAEGNEEAGFSKLSLDGIRARTGGVEQGAFKIPEVTVNRFQMEFSPDRKRRPPGEDREAPVAKPKVPGWLAKYLPNRAEVGDVILSSARVDVKRADGSTPFLMQGVKATVEPDFHTKVWEIQGQGGNIRIPDQPEIDLKDLAMRWRESELFIDRCGLGIYENGHVDGSGEINFSGEGNFNLELEISSIDVDELAEGEWKERLGGTISGPFTITGRPGAFVYEGTMNVAEAKIEAIPVLTVVAEYTRNDQFKHLVLSEAKTDFTKVGGKTNLENIVLQSDGLVRVEGDMVIQGEMIAGQFQVGVAPGTLRWIPGAERQIFTEQREGFLWTPMSLSGTVSEPKEDLSARLIVAAGEEILKGLPAGVLKEAQKLLNSGDGQKTTPGGLIEQGKPLLDLITPFLK